MYTFIRSVILPDHFDHSYGLREQTVPEFFQPKLALTLRRATSETSTVGIGGEGHMPPLEISGLAGPPDLKFGPVIDLHNRR